MSQRHLLPSALALCFFLGGCSPAAPDKLGVTNDGTYVSGTGTVTYHNLEGGFWAIKGDDNQSYDPVNLDRSYWTEGLRIRFRAALRKDLVSVHMDGPIVEILEIKRL